MRNENSAWSLVSSMIAAAAAREGVCQWRLEAVFRVGDGSGRLWRARSTGDRVARRLTRERIVADATSRGWLKPTKNQQADIEALPDEAIHALAMAAPCPIEPPAPPDHKSTSYTARRAASALFEDAQRKNGRLGTRREQATRHRNFKGIDLTIADDKAWRAAVQFVRDTPSEQHGVLKAQLIAAYRRLGYQ